MKFCIKSFCGLILISSVILTFGAAYSRSDSRELAFSEFQYPARLYLKKDYYRTATEVLRLKFHYPQRSIEHKLDLYLLKSHYHMEDYQRTETVARRMLETPVYRSDRPLIRETGVWLSGALLELNKKEDAARTWRETVGDADAPFPYSSRTPGLIDPEKAYNLSLFPGLGLAACGEYGKAAVSFLLNALFAGTAYHYFKHQDYALSALFLFFEAGWYKGGRNAAREAAVNHNRTLIERRRKDWMRTQINRLFPERSDDFEVIYRDIPGYP